MGHSWHTSRETFRSVLLIGSCHKNHEYIYGLGEWIWTVSKILSSLWSERGGTIPGPPWDTSLLELLNVFYHKKHEYIWFKGLGYERFPIYKAFMNWTGRDMPNHTRGPSRSVLLNASYHKKHEYIWLRVGDLNSFWDIYDFKNWLGLDMPPGQPLTLGFQI